MRPTGKALLALALAMGLYRAADAETRYHVANSRPLPDGGWDLTSFDPVGKLVYLARTDGLTVLKPSTGEVRTLAKADHGHAVVPLNGGTEVLLTDGGSGTARIIDAANGKDLADIPVGKWPDAAVLDPSTGLVAVMNARSGDVSLIDPKARKVLTTVQVGGGLELAAADGAGHVFINIEDRNELAVLDMATHQVRRVALEGCDGPTGIAYLPKSRDILSACANEVAVATKADTLKPDGYFPIGKGPDTVIYDHVRGLAFVPCGRSGDLRIFKDSEAGPSAGGDVATQLGARTGAVDEATGRIYLPAAKFTPPETPGGRPQIAPGSVTMLVVEP